MEDSLLENDWRWEEVFNTYCGGERASSAYQTHNLKEDETEKRNSVSSVPPGSPSTIASLIANSVGALPLNVTSIPCEELPSESHSQDNINMTQLCPQNAEGCTLGESDLASMSAQHQNKNNGRVGDTMQQQQNDWIREQNLMCESMDVTVNHNHELAHKNRRSVENRRGSFTFSSNNNNTMRRDSLGGVRPETNAPASSRYFSQLLTSRLQCCDDNTSSLDAMVNSWLKEKDLRMPHKRKFSTEYIPPSATLTTESNPSPTTSATQSTLTSEDEMHVLKSKLHDMLSGAANVSEFAKVSLSFVAKQVGAHLAGFYVNMSLSSVNWVLTTALPDTRRYTESFPFASLVSNKTIQKNTFVIDTSENSLSFAFTPLFTMRDSTLPMDNSSVVGSSSYQAIGLIVLGITITQEEKRKKIETLNELSRVISVQLRLTQLQLHNSTLKREYQNLVKEKLALQRSGFICTSCTGIITYCSESASSMLGYSVKELVGNNFNIIKLFAPEQVDEQCKQMSKKLKRKVQGFQVFTAQPINGDMQSAQWQFLRKDMSRVTLQTTIQPMLDNVSTAVGFAFTIYELQSDMY